jgi:hypothetical protein
MGSLLPWVRCCLGFDVALGSMLPYDCGSLLLSFNLLYLQYEEIVMLIPM